MDDTTTAIKQAVDIVAVISEAVRLEPFGSKFRGLCPFHDDHKPSFNVDPEYQSYRCWACGAKGDVYAFLQEFEKISFVEAKRRLAEKAGISLHPQNNVRSDPRQSLYRVLAWAQQEYQKCLFEPRTGAEARQYLHRRGLSEQTAREFGLGSAPDSFEWMIQRARQAGIDANLLVQAGLAKLGNRPTPYDAFRGRLMFPIRDVRDRVVAFGGRILPAFESDKAPKYLNSPATDVYHKSDVLFGLDVAKGELQNRGRSDKRERYLVVMEGYMDCVMAFQHGIRNAVATCGTALTPGHVSRLRAHADSVVLMFDGDAAGRKAARESVKLFLNAELEVRVCLPPDGLDPCDFLVERGAEAMRELLSRSPDALEFQIQQAVSEHDVRTVEGQHAALEQVLATLSTVPQLPRGPQAMKYQLALSRLSTRFGIAEQSLRQRIAELRRNEGGYQPMRRAVASPAETRIREPERQAAGLLVSQPNRAAELKGLLDPENIVDLDLRKLAEACYALENERGADADVDSLRERLNDNRLSRLVYDLCEAAPQGDAYERSLADLKERLQSEQRRKASKQKMQRLSPHASDEDHLEVLRQLNKR